MPVPVKTAPLRRTLLKDQVFDILRDAIVSGVLQPNERLRETELIERFGGTTASVRDALRMLSLRELVTVRPQRGSFVAPVDVPALREELQILGEVLTSTACRVLPYLDGSHVAKLEDAQRNLRDGREQSAFVALESMLDVFLSRAENRAKSEFCTLLLERQRRFHALVGSESLRALDVSPVIDAVKSDSDSALRATLAQVFEELDHLLEADALAGKVS